MTEKVSESDDSLSQRTTDRRRLRNRLLIAGAAALGLLLLDYFAYPYNRFGGRSFNRGANGLWLRYTWTTGLKPDRKTPIEQADYVALGDRLKRNQIGFAYFHVRNILKDGSLRFRSPQVDGGISGVQLKPGVMRRLTGSLRASAPGAKLLAWIYAGNSRGEGEVDLFRPEVRSKMVEEAVWLVKEGGFDGVQWDYEICREDEPGFIELLRETRAGLPDGALLSTATPLNMPWPVGGYGWSEGYYTRVARECDQICVMAYDSAAWLPRSYAWLVHRQAVTLTRAVASEDTGCRLLIGLPTYGPGFLSHNPRAENIRIALKGVREGLSDRAARPDVCDGVALFADYTTDEGEWQTFRELWLDGR